MRPPARGRRRRFVALLGCAVAVALAGCTAPTGAGSRSAMQTSAAAPGIATSGGNPGAAAPVVPSRGVTCDVHTCTLTLRTTDPREVEAFGSPVTLEGVQNGVASLTVGDARVECTQNEAVRAGSRTLFCDDVTGDSVTVTAEVG